MIRRTISIVSLFSLGLFSISGCGSNSSSDATPDSGVSDSSLPPDAASSDGSSTDSSHTLEPPVEATNTMVVTNQSDEPLIDYPLQFGRPFLQGEIAAFPVVYVDGKAIETQADVKQRWPDGSVRFAILSMMLDDLAPGGSATLGFGEQSTNDNTPLTTDEMLAPEFDFDARMMLTSGGSMVSASARKMLSDGHVSPWISGPIATTVILADHSAARTYDVGFDSHRSIRPIFEATFWPRTHQVRIRFIGENANTKTLQDVQYDLSLRAGEAAPAVVYEQAAVPHYFGTRWTRVAWTPSTPEAKVAIDYGLPYLTKTQFFPNFDTTRTVSEELITQRETAWATKPRGLFEEGFWTTYMPTTGGRSDIAPYPAWTNLWLRTGDPSAREIALAQADLAAAWPLHWREGEELTFDREKTVPGLGRTMSLNARPDLWFPDNNGNYTGTLPTPRLSPSNPWVADGAHQPDAFSPQYILTGDHFYLEEIQLWAGAQAFSYNRGQYGRGLDGYGGMQDQVRGNAWVLRNRANAAFLSPDGSPEKKYFNELVEDAIAMWEGQRNIRGTAFESHPQWVYGHDTIPIDASPLRFWGSGIDLGSTSLNGLDPNTTSRVEALWQHYYLLLELGIVRDQGFPTGPLLSWLAPLLNAQFDAPGYDPVLCRMYLTPIMDTQGKYFQTWADVSNAIPEATREEVKNQGPSANYYLLLAASAASSTYWEPKGDVAWAWLDSHVRANSIIDHGGQWFSWDIIPRPKDTKPLPLTP